MSVFFLSLFFTCHWISFVFLLYDQSICTHSVDPSLTHFLGEFPGLGLTLAPDVVVPGRTHTMHKSGREQSAFGQSTLFNSIIIIELMISMPVSINNQLQLGLHGWQNEVPILYR